MREKEGFLFILPALVCLILMVGAPLVFGLFASFVSWDSISPQELRFVGLGNFGKVLLDPTFLMRLSNTFYFVFGSLGLKIIIGLILALFLNRKDTRGKNIFIALLITPLTLSPVASGLLWRYMYEPASGTINTFLRIFRLPTPLWLASPSMAMPAIIIADIWQWSPLAMVLLLAGLRTLPPEPYEAAQLDGASIYQIFWFITLPLLKRSIFVTLLFLTIISLKVFGLIILLTYGGPGQSTEVLSLSAYRMGLSFFQISSGAALSQVILIISLGISMFFIKRLPLEY